MAKKTFTKMTKEEFVFLKSVTDDFKHDSPRAYSDIDCPVPTKGYKVDNGNGTFSWADQKKIIRIE